MECELPERDIDAIAKLVRDKFPKVKIEQLQVTHPSDDDGLWYFWMPGADKDDIKIESSFGKCPFLIETSRGNLRRMGNTVQESVSLLCSHLETSLYD